MAIMYVRDPDTGEFVPVIGGGSSVEVDATLSVSGKAADAKATGDALNEQKEANAQLIDVNDTEPTSENTKLWIDPDSDEVQIPQIDDSVTSEEDTWSSKKIAEELNNVELIPGPKGDTPQKGVDYWTAADKQGIVSDVLAALPTWEGGSY